MKERFTKMVEHPDYTTLWEGWGIGAEGFGGGTINHAWSGGGLTCLAQYAIGLEPTQSGFKEFVVKPQPGPLKKAKLVTPTKYGDIVVEMDRIDRKGNTPRKSFRLTITVPEGTNANVILPASAPEVQHANALLYQVSKNGETVTSTIGSQQCTPGVWVIEESALKLLQR
jgi:Bacterial alpha-L-rhamnosidase.